MSSTRPLLYHEAYRSLMFAALPHDRFANISGDLAKYGFVPVGYSRRRVVCVFCQEVFVPDDFLVEGVRGPDVRTGHLDKCWTICPFVRGYYTPNVPSPPGTEQPYPFSLHHSQLNHPLTQYVIQRFNPSLFADLPDSFDLSDGERAAEAELAAGFAADGYPVDSEEEVNNEVEEQEQEEPEDNVYMDSDAPESEEDTDPASDDFEEEESEPRDLNAPAFTQVFYLKDQTSSGRLDYARDESLSAPLPDAPEDVMARELGIIRGLSAIWGSLYSYKKRKESFEPRESEPRTPLNPHGAPIVSPWQHSDRVSGEFMARNGFILQPERRRYPLRCRCVQCGVFICDWPEDLTEDDVRHIHVTLSPKCKLAQLHRLDNTVKDQGQNTDNNTNLTCVCCLSNRSEIVFLGCGHLVSCAPCATQVDHCPVCRRPIGGYVKVFTP